MGEDPKEISPTKSRWMRTEKSRNVEMAMGNLDKNRFWKLLVETLKEYGEQEMKCQETGVPFETRFHDFFNRLYVISWGGFVRSRPLLNQSLCNGKCT